MQVSKNNTRRLLLRTARQAFLTKGYKAVNMREISETSGVGLSNIYNYFGGKDELLAEVLAPFIEAFEKMVNEHEAEAYSTNVEIFTAETYMRLRINLFVGFIEKFRSELKFLFFDAHGSRFENYRATLIDLTTQSSLRYMQSVRQVNTNANTDISDFFIHVTCMWWVGILEEIVSHDELTHADIERFISEYVRYGSGGWRAIMTK